jgi:ribokinase
MFDVVGLGACGIDYTTRVRSFASEESNKITTDNLKLNEGGVTANNLVQCARLGMKTAWCGTLGEDGLADHLLERFKEEGISAHPLRAGQTQVCWVIVNQEGEREIYVHPNATAQLTPETVEREFSGIIRKAKHFHTEAAVIPLAAAIKGAEIARQAGVKVFVDVDGDPSSLQDGGIGTREELLRLVSLADVIKLSERAGKTFFQEWEDQDVIHKLLEHAAVAVITLGSEGCIIADKKGVERCQGYKIACEDGTGAGDAFMGGLSYALLKGLPLREAGLFANACGACCCTKVGSRGSGTFEEVRRLQEG